jgi:hypothetical protein
MKHLLCLMIVSLLFGAMLPTVGISSDSDNNTGAGHTPDRAVLARLRKLAQSDPVTDFAAAKRKGDRRFLAMIGYAKTVPGVPDYDTKYAKYAGTKIIPGTTDAILSKEQEKILDAVKEYAERYNKLVLDEVNKLPRNK